MRDHRGDRESMETMREGGGRLQNGPTVTKTPSRLRIMGNDEDDNQMTSGKVAEMDPYRELELYLAKVNVSRYKKFPSLHLYAERKKSNYSNHINVTVFR